MLDGRAERLKIILGESDRHDHHPAYVELVQRARSAGMAGATVLHGIEGFGAASHLHTEHALRLSSDLPVVVVIVDRPDRIETFADEVDAVVIGGLAVRQPVEIIGTGDRWPGSSSDVGGPWNQEIEQEGSHMELKGAGKRLTVYCGEADRVGRHSLAKAIVELAREEGLAGATVVRGIEGFGASSHLRTTRILSLSDDLPVVIEIVDRHDRIESILPRVAEMIGDGLVTLEDVDVHLYRARGRAALDDEEAAPQ